MVVTDSLSPADEAAVEALRVAVRIPTVSHRDPALTDRDTFDDLLEDLAARFPALHEACDVIRLAGDALLLRWPGRGDDAPVILMAHSDVVPVAADAEWTHPPFDAGSPTGSSGDAAPSTARAH